MNRNQSHYVALMRFFVPDVVLVGDLNSNVERLRILL